MSSRGSRIGSLAGRLAAAAMVLALAAAPVMADKLIIFKNGKVMRVKSVTEEQGWTLAEIGKGNTIGVRTSQIAMVQDAAGDSAKKAPLPNQASVDNRGVNRGGGASESARGSDRNRSEEASSRGIRGVGSRAGRRAGDKRRGGKAGNTARGANANAQQPGVPGLSPLQPFNQQTQGQGFRNSRKVGGRNRPGSRIMGQDNSEASGDENNDENDDE